MPGTTTFCTAGLLSGYDLIKSDPFGEILDNAGTAVIGNVSFDTLYLSAIDIDNQADVARRIASTFIA